jgi:NAD(P)-dependent dehydrogenase (short-subunit alcohol dehydrogenase family)
MPPAIFPLHGRHVAIINGCSGFGLALARLVRDSGGTVSLLGGDEDHLHDAACALHGARIVVRGRDALRDMEDLVQVYPPIDFLIMPALAGQCPEGTEGGGFDPSPYRISELVQRALKLTPPQCQIALCGPEHEPIEDDLLRLLAEHASPAPLMMLADCDMPTIAAAVLRELLSRPARLQLLRGQVGLEETNN